MHALKELRIRQGLALAVFAKRIGWSKGLLFEVENGHKNVSDRMIGLLAQAFNLSIDDARRLASGEHVAALGGAIHGHEGAGVRDAARVPATGAGQHAG